MLKSSPSSSICNQRSEERRKLLQHKVLSSDSTRLENGKSYFLGLESLAFLVFIISAAFYNGFALPNHLYGCLGLSKAAGNIDSEIVSCKRSPCFEPSRTHVPLTFPGFPSFLKYAHQGPLIVSYDKRSLKINGKRVFFLGGSMHPARTTYQTWNFALDEAVKNGLNLITVYVMWSDHQPLPNRAIDWTFPDWSFPTNAACQNIEDVKSCDEWNLATAIRSAANRGLFVHLRVGPYDCAEYSYGGIPEWLLVQKPTMRLRRPNKEWLETMESFVTQMIDYVSDNELWAHQGGPIIMSQIENELGSGDDKTILNENNDDGILFVNSRGEFVNALKENMIAPIRKANLQDYANWCGEIANKYAPHVTWTMCNGLSANNTIHTCNAINDGADWLENHGGNGRIQVDQPPLLTEFEEGFQDWGETPEHPNDYFWGRTASDATRNALRWFSRGGTHLNYYMFFGAYNRGRQAAAGIGNWYATDAALCSSGQRHEPKFSHYRSLHEVIAHIAPTLLSAETALGKAKAVEVLNRTKGWVIGKEQRMFEYVVRKPHKSNLKNVIFVENDQKDEVLVRIPFSHDESTVFQNFTLESMSSILIVDMELKFDSAAVSPKAMSYKREFANWSLLGWSFWPETIGVKSNNPMTQINHSPIEQTRLNVGSNVWSDYAWYETFITTATDLTNVKLFLECQRSNGLFVFVNNSFVGDTEDHSHLIEGNFTMSIELGQLPSGEHKLSILSESLGYSNLVGRFGNSGTGPKLKGISGQVFLFHDNAKKNISLVDGREWKSFPGLNGEKEFKKKRLQLVQSNNRRPVWASVLFQSPTFNPSFQSLFLQITTGRGHLWLNGKDLGRYWNITQGNTSKYSQKYYLLPVDYLRTDGGLNEIIIFNTLCESTSELEEGTKLVLSWLAPTKKPNLKDEVSYKLACI